MKVTTVGLDLAKTLFQVHGVDSQGHVVVRKQLRRADVLAFFAKLEPCVVGMEACGSSHYWGRELAKLGHTVRLIAPQFVRPYVKSNKTDAADAEAICEAVQRPHMRFVPVKTPVQQTILSLHRARAGLVKSRTALANQIRGLLGEFGIALPQGIRLLGQRAMEALSTRDREHSEPFRALIQMLVEHLRELGNKVAELEGRIRAIHRTDAPGRLLESIPGIGPLTASALAASIGDARAFRSGRELAAWLGLVPRQHSSGGTPRLLGISKRGDTALRTLLIHGARAVIRMAAVKPEMADSWLMKLCQRRHKNIAAVALAAKNARTAWAMLIRNQAYQAGHVPARSSVTD
ncbi:IS110 family transposase [Paraburkholderia panacisoli]|uniref:IS110 family transposase n=1 Tax=Paraburkholderia panacisoli TaxID=2603818 RepID=A0A5B0G5J4_9BURK|nr:IS110 family transposase [Paraburkholderia panacisoli]KAA0998687.1 IS110 family transposase [Paraburkholderia panacisoli]